MAAAEAAAAPATATYPKLATATYPKLSSMHQVVFKNPPKTQLIQLKWGWGSNFFIESTHLK